MDLQVSKVLPLPEQYVHEGVRTTVDLSSDGMYFYWLWCAGAVGDKNAKGQAVCMDIFALNVSALSIWYGLTLVFEYIGIGMT